MTILGSLRVLGIYDGRRFDRSMDKSRKKTKSFGKELFGLKGKFLAVIGTAGATAFIKSQLDTIDALGKTSDKLGIATEDLGAFQFAARKSGVSVTTLNTAIQRMERRASEAVAGNEQLTASFAELGLTTKELKALAPADLFREVGKGLNNIAGQGDKLRLAMRVFDTEGVALVNTFAQNLDKVEKEFAQLGGGLSGKGVKRIEEFNDQITKLSTAISLAGGQFLIDIAPGVTGIIERTERLFRDVNEANAILRGEDIRTGRVLQPAATAAERAGGGTLLAPFRFRPPGARQVEEDFNNMEAHLRDLNSQAEIQTEVLTNDAIARKLGQVL